MSEPRTISGLWPRLALLAGMATLVGAIYATGLNQHLSWDYLRGHVSNWQEFTRENLLLAALLYFLLYVAFTALSLPAALILSLLGGALFGRWLGVVLITVASTLGASLAFLGSRYLFRAWVRQALGPRLASLDRGIKEEGVWFLFTLRLLPIVPYFLINLGMALTAMPLRRFALVSFLGMVPASLILANAGTELGQIQQPTDALSPSVLGSLALMGLFPLALRLLVRWLRKTRTAPGDARQVPAP